MEDFMEALLHYVWQHRMFPLGQLFTTPAPETTPQTLEIIDPGLHNLGAGPDFFNAKIRIGEQMWVGNVEIHLRSSDWYRHHHEQDAAYSNVILHVVGMKDCEVSPCSLEGTLSSRLIPTLILPIPPEVEANYRELLAEEAYPPCYRIIPQLSSLNIHSWMSALTVERLESKTERIEQWLERTRGDWDRTFFITLARAFGFGTNADAFERWGAAIDPQHIVKHRDNHTQILAFFLGMAGFLDKLPDENEPDKIKIPGISCEDTAVLLREWKFLSAKFRPTPLPRHIWKTGRLRPQNFPQVRLAQLAELYASRRLDFSKMRNAASIDELRKILTASTETYTLSDSSIDLLIVNAVAPTLFAYGRNHADENICERAFNLLESIKPEHNFITRSWARAGITSQHAADSQALIQLRTRYCDRKDCLRCRFGAAYLKKTQPKT